MSASQSLYLNCPGLDLILNICILPLLLPLMLCLEFSCLFVLSFLSDFPGFPHTSFLEFVPRHKLLACPSLFLFYSLLNCINKCKSLGIWHNGFTKCFIIPKAWIESKTKHFKYLSNCDDSLSIRANGYKDGEKGETASWNERLSQLKLFNLKKKHFWENKLWQSHKWLIRECFMDWF